MVLLDLRRHERANIKLSNSFKVKGKRREQGLNAASAVGGQCRVKLGSALRFQPFRDGSVSVHV